MPKRSLCRRAPERGCVGIDSADHFGSSFSAAAQSLPKHRAELAAAANGWMWVVGTGTRNFPAHRDRRCLRELSSLGLG
eukprot:6182365-Pleurochrysis_carterae.AAC.3